jgi:WD40 repeat protein
MKLKSSLVALVIVVGVLISGCVEPTEEPDLPTQTSIPPTQITAPEPSPTEVELIPTLTNTSVPSPTPTPKPSIPENVALLSYRTLGQVQELVSIPLADVIDLEFSPDSRYLRMRTPSGVDTFKDIFFDVLEWEEVFSLEGSQRIYFNSDSTSISVLEGNDLTIIGLPGGDNIDEYTGRNQSAALSPDGRRLVEIEVHQEDPISTTLRMIDLPTGEEIFWLFVNAEVEKDNLVFDGDGKFLGVSYFVPPGTSVVTVWNAQTGRVMFTKYGFAEIDLHPFASEVAVSSSRRSSISLFSTVTWEQRLYLGSDQEEPGYYNVAYSSGGRLIYALTDRETTIASFWFPPSGELIDLDLGLDLLAVTISPDRRYLATSDKSGDIVIWGVVE